MDLVAYVNNLVEGYVEVDKQPWTTKEEALRIAQKAEPYLQRMLRKAATRGAKVIVGIKPSESIDNKLARWVSVGRGIETMFDILRGSIIVEDVNDIPIVNRRLTRGMKLVKYEFKKDPDEHFGYHGSHHLDLFIPQFEIVVEVQVMTRQLYHGKKIAHPMYSEYRHNPEVAPPEVKQKSQSLFHYANRPRKFKLKREREQMKPIDDLEDL